MRVVVLACALVTCALGTTGLPGCTLPAGAPCCAEDTDCADGARCFEGQCALLCDDDSQCEDGETCDDVGVCRAPRGDDACVTRTGEGP